MKHTMKTLDDALDILLPKIKIAKENGVSFDRPSLINMVATQHFNLSFDSTWNPTYTERLAYYVVQEASIDLHENGCMSFGDMTFDFGG